MIFSNAVLPRRSVVRKKRKLPGERNCVARKKSVKGVKNWNRKRGT